MGIEGVIEGTIEMMIVEMIEEILEINLLDINIHRLELLIQDQIQFQEVVLQGTILKIPNIMDQGQEIIVIQNTIRLEIPGMKKPGRKILGIDMIAIHRHTNEIVLDQNLHSHFEIVEEKLMTRKGTMIMTIEILLKNPRKRRKKAGIMMKIC